MKYKIKGWHILKDEYMFFKREIVFILGRP
jgi:hypothetical protein